MIFVIAAIEVRAGKRAPFLTILNANVPNVLAEAGCLGYAPAIDVASGIPAQAPPRDDVVTIVEQWESLDHLRAHLAAPHMAAYREQVKDIVEKVSLQVLTSADTKSR